MSIYWTKESNRGTTFTGPDDGDGQILATHPGLSAGSLLPAVALR